MATFVTGALGGVDPSIMGVGPVASTKKALAKANMTIDDMDLIEANEAFAAQSVAVAKRLKIRYEQSKRKRWCYCSWTSSRCFRLSYPCNITSRNAEERR